MTQKTSNTHKNRPHWRPGAWISLLMCTIFLSTALTATGLGASGCQPDASNCAADSDCDDGLVCASGGGLLVRGGVCVLSKSASIGDAGREDATDQDTNHAGKDADAQECVPKTCAELGVTCGVANDGCGATLQCGGAECIASLSAGPQHSCAVRGDGSIYCWGANQGGQLGSGDFDPRPTPHPVLMSSVDFKALMVSTGQQHSCAINENGIAWCWGANVLRGSGDCFGQLGTGDDCATLPISNRPSIAVDRAEVQPNVVSLQTRQNLNCMRNHAGQIYCWGDGAHGQVGNGESLTENPAPTPLKGYNEPIHSLALSKCYVCGLAADGLVCWGDFVDGCAGSGEQNEAELLFDSYDFEPDVCATPNGCIAGGRAHTCFIDASATVYCFNDNASGQLGVDPSTADSQTPVEVEGLPGYPTQITAGDRFSCALQSDGEVYCWGANGSGQLGDGSEDPTFTPVKVGLSGSANRLSAGASHACAALDSGEIQCWGANDQGQLGDGNTGAGEKAATPVTVQF